MSTMLICMAPIIYSLIILGIGWYIGRHGSPVRWVGWQRRHSEGGTATRVTKEYD